MSSSLEVDVDVVVVVEVVYDESEALLLMVGTRGLVCARRMGIRARGLVIGRASRGVCGVRGELELDPVELDSASHCSASPSFLCWRVRLLEFLAPCI